MLWMHSRSLVFFVMSFILSVTTTRGVAARTTSRFTFGAAAFLRPGGTSSCTTPIAMPPAVDVASITTRRRQLPSRVLLLSSQEQETNKSDDDDDDDDDNGVRPPTWNYVPYDPTIKPIRPPHRRSFSTWTVPKSIEIPEDRLEISFVRSSGAGGQNVNKVNTKVELRFHVGDADWIPEEVRGRLQEQQANRINKDGYLSIQSQEYRTQVQNRKAAVAKLNEMLLQAWPRPKIRKQRTGVSKVAKERNKEFKKKRSETKANRRKVDF